MSRCPACYQNSVPEAVSEVTVNETTITMDGAKLKWYDEYYTTVSAQYDSISKTLTLPHMPLSASAVQLVVNTGVQGQNTTGAAKNFSVSSNLVALFFTPDAADIIHVHYMAYESNEIDIGDEPVGTMQGYSGTTAPTGWLLMDGTTSYLIADYPALYAFCVAAGGLILSTAGGPPVTSFILNDLNSYFLKVAVAVETGTIIKT